jgi:hypothetical protein
VTWHPFGTLSEWSKLASGDRVRSALQKHTSLLEGQTVVDAVVDAVVSRTWLLLLHGRQDDLMPTPAELKKILMELNRM